MFSENTGYIGKFISTEVIQQQTDIGKFTHEHLKQFLWTLWNHWRGKYNLLSIVGAVRKVSQHVSLSRLLNSLAHMSHSHYVTDRWRLCAETTLEKLTK